MLRRRLMMSGARIIWNANPSNWATLTQKFAYIGSGGDAMALSASTIFGGSKILNDPYSTGGTNNGYATLTPDKTINIPPALAYDIALQIKIIPANTNSGTGSQVNINFTSKSGAQSLDCNANYQTAGSLITNLNFFNVTFSGISWSSAVNVRIQACVATGVVRYKTWAIGSSEPTAWAGSTTGTVPMLTGVTSISVHSGMASGGTATVQIGDVMVAVGPSLNNGPLPNWPIGGDIGF